jgi:hypothetical protein
MAKKLGKSPVAKEEDKEGLFASCSFTDLGLHPTLCAHLQGSFSPSTSHGWLVLGSNLEQTITELMSKFYYSPTPLTDFILLSRPTSVTSFTAC